MSTQINEQDNNNNELKSFKDITSINDLDFDKIELVRGETPEDIKEKCVQLCKDYLSGNWSQQTVHTIEVRRVTGGLVNQLYYCGIKEPNSNEEVPQEVAIRLYGEAIFNADEGGRMRDMVISLMFSAHKLGPKIYGLFEGGQIQQFYKHRPFFGEDQKNPAQIRKVMRRLAQIHCLDVPIKKDPQFLFKEMTAGYYEAIEKSPIHQMIDEYNCETLKKYDLKTEFDWIKDVIQRVKSPVVFTHNDFRSSNLMITEPNDEIVVCDYDLSCYGYRGHDFVGLFREWGQKPLESFKSIEGLPLESQFRPVIEIYVEECERIHGRSYSENEINSVDHILKEVKTFLLFSFLLYTTLCFKNDENNNPVNFPLSRKLIMEFADSTLKNYLQIKDILKVKNIVE